MRALFCMPIGGFAVLGGHTESAMFWKNVSMLGGAILIAQFGGGPISVDAAWSRSGWSHKTMTKKIDTGSGEAKTPDAIRLGPARRFRSAPQPSVLSCLQNAGHRRRPRTCFRKPSFTGNKPRGRRNSIATCFSDYDHQPVCASIIFSLRGFGVKNTSDNGCRNRSSPIRQTIP